MPETNESAQIYQLTGEQIVRQIALDAALRQQLHGVASADNPNVVTDLIDAAGRIADWLRA